MLKFLKSRELWFTIVGMILLSALLFFLFFWVFLPAYTRHGKTVRVPEVTKLHLEKAQAKLDSAGLKPVVADSLYIAGMEPLSIISQDPSGLDKVKPDRPVYLTVNKRVPPMVAFPDIFNVSNYQAKLQLESWNLNIKKIKYVPNKYKNLVLAAKWQGKKLKAGDTLPVGSRVELIVGKGKGSILVELPDLVGETFENAISIMHELGLNVGARRFKPDEPGEPGLIIKQDPPYRSGDSIALGEELSLFISGPEPEETMEGIFLGEEDEDADNSTTTPDGAIDTSGPNRSSVAPGSRRSGTRTLPPDEDY